MRAAAPAATLTYPGAAPCNTTLQACINGAAPGDTVAIATSSAINESLTVTQSLTLTAATGFTPVRVGFESFRGGAAATSFTISGLTIDGTLSTVQLGAGDLDADIIGNTIDLTSSSGVGIELDSFQAPPTNHVTFEVRGNTVTVLGGSASDQCRGLVQGGAPNSGSSTSSIVDNRFTVTNCGEGARWASSPAAAPTSAPPSPE